MVFNGPAPPPRGGMIIVKLGGSVITDKKRPLTARPRAIASMAAALSAAREPLIVVHGGGSFGHYWSVRHDMHTRPARHDPAAVAAVKNSMVDLDAVVLRAMARKGIGPYAIPPHALVRPGGAGAASAPAVREAGRIAESGLVPVTYGDALWRRGGMSYIMSGDRLVSMLSLALRPRLAIFATDVDGLYEDMASRALIPRVGAGQAAGIAAGLAARGSGPAGRPPRGRGAPPPPPPDVTGGIRRKVLEAARMAGAGIDVAIVNGNRPGRILEAAAAAGRGRRRPGPFTGTLFPGAVS